MGRRNRKGSKSKNQTVSTQPNNVQGKGKDNNEFLESKTSNTSGERRHVHGRDKEQGANDVNWYTHIYSVSEPLARVSFNIMTGSKYNPLSGAPVRPYSGGGTWGTEAMSHAVSDPGILAYSVQPVMGDSEAANIAATQLYSLVRQANSGAKNYDKTDMMMMVMAMDSAYMLYEYLLRAFRVCKSWDYLNRYTPEVLLMSMGFHKNIMTELANLEATLNLYAYRLAALCVPDQFDFIHRHSWLFSNIYEDENNGRSQMYILNPRRLYVWTEGEGDQPTYLKATEVEDLYTIDPRFGQSIGSVSQVQEMIDHILTPLFGSEDVGLMNGDLIKAFGDGGMIKINPVDTTPLGPVHNDEVLEQLMNADIVSDNDHPVTFMDMDIKQDLSSLTAGPQLVQDLEYITNNNNGPRNSIKSLLNAFDDISSERIITSTRFKFTIEYKPNPSDIGTERIKSCGTEIIESAQIWYRNSHDQYEYMPFISRPSWQSGTVNIVTEVSKFRYHPTMYIFRQNGSNWQYLGYIQDSCVTAWLDDDWIEKMNEVAVMSEYAVKDFKTGLS